MKLLKGLLFVSSLIVLQSLNAQVVFNLDAAKRGAEINPLHYGIFFEEINHAGDGGLYAELVRNRSFEENSQSADYWRSANNSTLSLTQDYPLNSNNPTALKVVIRAANSGARNEGYWGMKFVKGETYKISLWARVSEGEYSGTLKAQIRTSTGKTIGTASFKDINDGWQKFSGEITASQDADNGYLAVIGSKTGTIFLDMVSLFPPTYKGRENGCRKDLAEKLEALNPAFMRFPGGCYIEGNWTSEHPGQNRFEWKKTIGPIEERPGHYNNNWFYPVTDGLGMLEFLELCEDLDVEPLFVVNMGMGHGWEDPNVEPYIQEALDAIEFCNGDASTTWGKKRIELGHPEPFNLRLLEIGNENYWFGPYGTRYGQFRKAIGDKYPDIVFIGDGDGILWGLPHAVDVIDQHYYMTPAWFTGEYHRYDSYNRNTYKIYVGEYAVTGACGHYGNMNAALGEAAFMCGMENNSDVVTMTSYAPIFVNENSIQWAPDIIRFNSSMSYGTPSYYVQQMMSKYHGTQNIKWSEENNTYTAANKVGFSTYFTSAEFDNLVVTSLDGEVLYSNDFSDSDLSDFTIQGGTWSVKNGKLCQTNTGMAGEMILLNKDFGDRYIVQCDAVKKSGSEGFLLVFNYMDSDDYIWWNVGGWANEKQGIEQTMSGTRGSDGGDVKNFDGITNNTSYQLRVRVEGNVARCYLNNSEVNSKTITPKSQKIYLASNIDDESKVLYIKAVNPYDTAQETVFNVKNIKLTGGERIRLTSRNGSDENTTTSPSYIVPKTSSLSSELDEHSISTTLPAHSFTIFAVEYTDDFDDVDDLPEPLVKYSFEPSELTDDSGVYTYRIMGNGEIKEMSDHNHAFYSDASGYIALGKDMPNAVLKQLTGDYAVSIDIFPTDIKPLNSFSWAYGLCAGTDYYVGLVNSPTNKNWYYEIHKTTSNNSLNCDGGLQTGRWHNVTFSQENGVGSIYLDGVLMNTRNMDIRPSEIASSINASYIGKSAFSGDALMSNAYFDDFQFFDKSLSASQVANLAKNARSRSLHIYDPVGIEDVEYTKPEPSRFNGVYSIQGAKLADSLDELGDYKGIVIYNGKKIVVQ